MQPPQFPPIQAISSCKEKQILKSRRENYVKFENDGAEH